MSQQDNTLRRIIIRNTLGEVIETLELAGIENFKPGDDLKIVFNLSYETEYAGVQDRICHYKAIDKKDTEKYF